MYKDSSYYLNMLKNSDNVEEKLFAIKKLVLFKKENIAQEVIPYLDHSEPVVRYVTAQTLGYFMFDNVGKALLEALVEPEEWVRLEIVEAIGKVKPKNAIPILLKYLETESDNKIKATIIKVLGILNDEKVIPYIAQFLNSSDERVKANTIEALENFENSRILELLKPFKTDKNNRVRANTALLFVKKGKSEGYEILEDMLKDDNEWMVASAVYSLGEISNEQALSIMEKNNIFENKNWSIRRNVIIALAKMVKEKIDKAEKLFLNFLNSPDEEDVLFAVEMAGVHGLKKFLPVLTEKLSTLKGGDLREKIDEAIDSMLEVVDENKV
ncbi:MAG: HEAT repeat domain-containing protein [Candidatus Muiribacteriota bacterium]